MSETTKYDPEGETYETEWTSEAYDRYAELETRLSAIEAHLSGGQPLRLYPKPVEGN